MNLTTIVVLMTLIASGYAAAFLGAGCPDGHKPGETWNPPGCMECSCGDTTYACYSCGLTSSNIDRSQCYTEKNVTASYPECCDEKVVCKGDPGFNASKLNYPEKKTTTTTTPPRRPKTTRPVTTKRKPT